MDRWIDRWMNRSAHPLSLCLALTAFQMKSPDPCGGTVPTAAALVMTLLLKNYDASTAEGREGLAMAKRWEKEVFLAEAEAAQV